MSYFGESYRVVLNSPVTNNTVTMSLISGLTLNLNIGTYKIEFIPLYNVNATTTGVGFNFQGGTAVLNNYSFDSIINSSSTADFNNNYSTKNQDFTTSQTPRLNSNRATIIAEFTVTTAGTLIPAFRSEVTGGTVTLIQGSYINVIKIN